ncbi:MAG: FliH/SctL family protein [Terracidiphilus sp.]
MGSATKNGGTGSISIFQYPDGPTAPSPLSWEAFTEAAETPLASRPEPAQTRILEAGAEARLRAEFDHRLAEETRRSFEAGREKGRLEGRQAEREGQAAATASSEERRIRQSAELIQKFAEERDRFLSRVEEEVVELSLVVAARILRREAQMDPLLLTGAVRVALGQLSGSTRVRVQVPPADLNLWTEALALLPNLPVKPQVLAEEGMRLGDCIIETELGSVDLGIRSQLAEIERGFFDRAGGRRTETGTTATIEPQPARQSTHLERAR